MDFIFTLIGATLRISTPILFAALGETIIERSGVLNLGIEGTMMMSAFTGFFAAQSTCIRARHYTFRHWISAFSVSAGLCGTANATLINRVFSTVIHTHRYST